MASSIQGAKLTGFAGFVPHTEKRDDASHRRVYSHNRHRIYSLAFWMTDNELAAEDLTKRIFRRAFAGQRGLSAEALDESLVAEFRKLTVIGPLTLKAQPETEVKNVRSNLLRVHLERAVVQLPATERLIFLMHDVESYDDARIARTLGMSDDEVRLGLHEARLRIRELVAGMV